MLSYMLPAVEDKSPLQQQQQSRNNINLSLNLNSNNNHSNNHNNHNNLSSIAGNNRAGNNITDSCDENESDENTKLLNGERGGGDIKTNNSSFDNDNNENNDSFKENELGNNKKLKFGGKTGNTKGANLKRVSFGSSKGSMVETLVFETPTPLPEHAEREFTFSSSDSHNNGGILGKPYSGTNGSSLDDSGIGLQEEVERSKVRVTFFQSGKPQQVSPPETHIGFFGENNNSILIESLLHSETSSIDEKMAATVVTTIPPTYDRQMSTESGWDNPFRPGGDLSREADEIVNLIKGGKPITPTGEPNFSIINGDVQNHPPENGTTVVDGAVKVEAPKLQSTQNGTKTSPQKAPVVDKAPKNGEASKTQISNQVLPTPQSASHVTIEDKKKKKSCCVVQ